MNHPESNRSEKEIQAEIVEDPSGDDRRQPEARSRLALLSVLLTVVVAGLAFGYVYWQELRSTLGRLDQAISSARERQTEFRHQLEDMQRELQLQQQKLAAEQARRMTQESDGDRGQQWLEQERQQLQQQRVEMQETLRALRLRAEPSGTGWLLAEVEYLIRLASYRLDLVRDVGGAIRSLEAAERRLRETGDRRWVPIRETLAADIGRLQGVALPDPAALSARLAGLEQQVLSLGLVADVQRIPQEPNSETQPATPLEERTFRTLLHDGWDGLKSALVIRRHDKPVRAGLPPEQQYFVYQNLRLQLAAVRLALLRGDQSLYESGLQTVAQWLQEFFDPESAAARTVLGELADLRQIDLRPALPDISGSLVALREQMTAGGEEGAAE